MNTLVISAFPACGKTYLTRNQETLKFKNNEAYKFRDSDSSTYEKVQGWEQTYVNDIKKDIGHYDFIFIAQHDGILSELGRQGIPFVTIVPNNSPWISDKDRLIIKQQWFGRFILRDNSHIKDFDRWMQRLKDNYDNWTSIEHIQRHNPVSFKLLGQSQYISDIIEELYWKKERHPEKYCYKE